MATAEPSTRRRWWSPQPARTDTPLISTRRAYTEVLVVFGSFFAASIAAAAFSVAGHNPSTTVSSWAVSVPASIDQVFTTVLCILVPLLLVQRRGITTAALGLGRRRGAGTVDLSTGIRMAAWATLALIAGGVVTGALESGTYPIGAFSYPNLTLNLFHGAQAGFIEEIVVLGFVVVTLEQARRPRWEIVAVALLLRDSYHIYYGPGALGIFVWASVFLWLYLRFRTLVPLIIVHSLWDLFAILGQRWKGVEGLEVLVWFALFLTAFVLWLVLKSGEGPVPAEGAGRPLAMPGWYDDPWDRASIRWFDGWRWTPGQQPRPLDAWAGPSRPDPLAGPSGSG